ncbi:MAG TPA: 16S rRNA (guanine(527)-N(7))-methyltransferase RsmG [Casimicrobiaceae bacterium]|nr:16S rRNA (guanine(527)-N(7))-methyltransferase RsmG [Casimicrobiaceae bacterium]
MTAGEALADGIAALGLDLDHAPQTKLLAYLTLLEKWNRAHNLTSIRGVLRMVSHHLLDSLAVLPHLPHRAGLRLIDVGSGGGLPGIPLAIARPAWHVVLLDSSQKKCAFLRQAAGELKLGNAEVVNSRAESFVPPRFFDVVIARAFSGLAEFAAIATHLLARGARLVAMKGAYPKAEIAALPSHVAVVAVHPLEIPGVEGQRHLVIMEMKRA